MALFADRRSARLVDVTNPADNIRAGLRRPDKPGQATRAKLGRLDRVHADVQSGHAVAMQMAPVPGVVQQHVARTVLPEHPYARGFKGALSRMFTGGSDRPGARSGRY